MIDAKSARAIQRGQVLSCHVVRGLQLVSNSGGTSWMLYYRSADGTRRRPKLGDYPALTIEQARSVARELLANIAAGRDPAVEREKQNVAPLMSALWDYYLEHHAKRRKKPRSVKEDESLWRHFCTADLQHRRVADVTEAHTAALHAKVTKAGTPLRANRLLALLSKMFSIAESKLLGWRPRGSNPCKEIERNPERRRRVAVRAEQFDALGAELRRLEAQHPRHVAAIYLLLITGARVGELLNAKRTDLSGAVLTLDEHKTERTGEPRVIHLSRQALALIATLPQDSSGRLLGRMGHKALHNVWAKARDAAGLQGVQMRDLRRTFASVALSRAGVSLDQNAQLLGHNDTDTTLIYAHLMPDVAQTLTQRTTDEIQNLLEGPAKGKAAP